MQSKYNEYYGKLLAFIRNNTINIKYIDTSIGKGVFAKRDIAKGETILIEESPLVSQVIYPFNELFTNKLEPEIIACAYCHCYLDCVKPLVAKPVDPSFIQKRALNFDEETKVPEKAMTIIPCPTCSAENTLHNSCASSTHWNMAFGHYIPYTKLHTKLNYKELYCSENCKTKAWFAYHKLLCPGVIKDEQKYDALMALLVCYRENKLPALLILKILAYIELETTRTMDYETELPFEMFSSSIEDCFHKILYRLVDPVGEDATDEEAHMMENTYKLLYTFSKKIFPKTTWEFFKKILAILLLNSQSCKVIIPGMKANINVLGLYIIESCFNHCCDPNAEHADEQKSNHKVIIKAKKSIKKGEEIYINYIHPTDFKYRKTILKRRYNFYCQCNYCINEEEDWG